MGRKKKVEITAENTAVSQETVPAAETVIPHYTDWEWTDYVLGHLKDGKELIEGKPTQSGLFRIFSKVLPGEYIIESCSHVVQSPEPSNNNRAVVEHTIVLGTGRKFTDVADCYAGNTPEPYCRHPTATASTLAMGRCLRKAMFLRQGVNTAEEVANPDRVQYETATALDDSQSPRIDDSQINVALNVCKRLGVDLTKVVGFNGVPPFNTVEKIELLTHEQGSSLLRLLNQYSRNLTPIPENVKLTNPS